MYFFGNPRLTHSENSFNQTHTQKYNNNNNKNNAYNEVQSLI